MTLFASLPLHPLLVHVPVVLVPLLAVGTVGLAVRRSWLERFGVLAAGLAVVAAVGTLLASQSGEDLQESVRRTAAVRAHTELGDQAKVVVAAFLLTLFVWIALDWWWKRRGADRAPARAGLVGRGLMVASLAFGALATVWVFRAGHSGATAVWGDKTVQTTGGDNG